MINAFSRSLIFYAIFLFSLYGLWAGTSTYHPPLLCSNSPYTFAESEITAVPGETVQICVDKLVGGGEMGTTLATVEVVGSPNPHLSGFTSKTLYFPVGVTQACFDLTLSSENTSSTYELQIQGISESLLTITVEAVLTGQCGVMPPIVDVPLDQAKVVDRFGNLYSSSMIKLPTTQSSLQETSGGGTCDCASVGIDLEIFNPVFEDCILPGITNGFADPITGGTRREVICAVLAQLEQLIGTTQSNCDIDMPDVNVKIMPSYAYPDYATDGDLESLDASQLGYASFYAALGTNGSIAYPAPWAVFNTGENPEGYGEDEYHMYARFNFEFIDFFTDYTNPTVPGELFDLYTVALHEFTHALGFASSFALDPLQQLIPWGNLDPTVKGFYFPFDLYLTYDEMDVLSEYNPGGTINNGGEYTFNSMVNYLDFFTGCSTNSDQNLLFSGEIPTGHTVFVGSFSPGTSFSHLDGNCVHGSSNFVPFVMHPNFIEGDERRTFLDAELDVLRTIGYDINCNATDYSDFDCTTEECIVAAVGERPALEQTCLTNPDIFTLEICPPTALGEVTIEIPIATLLANDINAQGLAYARVNDGNSSIELSSDETALIFSTTTTGLHDVTYAVTGCGGEISNDVLFTVRALLSDDPDCLFFCPVPISGPELAANNGLSLSVTFDDCVSSVNCDLLCNGSFCGAVAGNSLDHLEEDLFAIEAPYKKLPEFAFEDFIYSNSSGATPTEVFIGGWARASAAPWFISSAEEDAEFNAGAVGILSALSSPGLENTAAGIISYVPFEPNTRYLLGVDIGKLTNHFSANISLLFGQSFTPSGQSIGAPPPLYDNVSQVVFSVVDDNTATYPNDRFRLGIPFTATDAYNGIYFNGQYNVDNRSVFLMDDVELMEDDFSAGDDLFSVHCNQVWTLGGESFCMLSDMEIQYDWYRVDENGGIIEPALISYTQLNGILTGENTFDVAPAVTTTYRLVRTIQSTTGPTTLLDFCETLADGSEICHDSDDVVVFVENGAPSAVFSAAEGDCGEYQLNADPSTENMNHEWSLITNGAPPQLFSNAYLPDDLILGNGDFTIIHTVTNDCSVNTFELDILGVDCGTAFACPCDDPNTVNYNIDAGAGLSITETPLWALATANALSAATYDNTNGCIAIKGRLIIDETAPGNWVDFGILGGEIRMQPGAEIVVENNGPRLALKDISQNGGIHGCVELWQGITSSLGSELYMENCALSDAVYGVTMNDKSVIDLIDNDLTANYVGLYTEDGDTKVIYSRGDVPLVNNSFTGSTLLPPYEGTNSQAGIFLNNTIMEIGQSNDEQNVNKFSAINNGIIASESNIAIHSTEITNLPVA